MSATNPHLPGDARPRLTGRPLAALTGETFDLVVVGGGITGAGIARHAAQVGLSVLLLEAGDFAAGTSSRSTKLIHGGLRYLAMGEIALVRDSALERKSVLEIAPHLTEPRWMLVPARTRAEFWKLRLGIGLYERLGAVTPAERHRNLTAAQLAQLEPSLNLERLRFACVYREYLTDDARLVLAALRAAVRDGAEVRNYARVAAVAQDAGGCVLRVTDEQRGADPAREYSVRGRAVVNATGPWVDTVLRHAAPPARGTGALPRLHLSKGVHLVLSRTRLPVNHMVMMTAADGRPVFAIARGAVTYVGTTDTSFRGDASTWPEVASEDIAYLLDTVNGHFTGRTVTADEVLAAWAGLRPLINQPGKAPKEMSRRDEIWVEGRLITVAGGKLTGFRTMAEQAMQAVGHCLGRKLVMPTPLQPVPGGDGPAPDTLRAELEARYGVEAQAAERLVRLYGSEARDVLGERPVRLSSWVFREEVLWAVEVEGARTLEDVIYRRLRAAWFLPAQLPELLESVATVLAHSLGWDSGRRAAELSATRARLAAEVAFRSDAATAA